MAGEFTRSEWSVEAVDDHLMVTFANHTNAPQPFRVAFTHHGAATFAHDLMDAVDPEKAQITFREAIEQDDTMSPEDKEHWLAICDAEGV